MKIEIKEKFCALGEKVEKLPEISAWKIILLTFISVCIILTLLIYGYFHSKYDRIFKDGYNESWAEDYEEKINVSEELEIAMWESTVGSGVEDREAVEATGEVIWDDDVINILLIGTDERTDGTYSENARGDAIMLLSVNISEDVPVISLVSLERGMGVPILKGPYAGQWDWLTHTFRYGGAELLMEEVSECLKIDVSYYVRVNFNIFIHAIDTLGGVTVNFDEAEAEAFRKDGMPYAIVGDNHLNGKQALAYARLRYIDSDWIRIQRQREIVLSVLESCRGRSFEELDSLVNSLLPLVKTNIPESKVGEFMMLIPRIRKAETQQMTVPVAGTYGHMIGMGERSMFAVDFEANSQILKDFLYPQYKKEE
jgi:LCP family protein required for cell wall assembly